MPVCAGGGTQSPLLSPPRAELLVSIASPALPPFSPSPVDSVPAQGGQCCQPPGLLRPGPVSLFQFTVWEPMVVQYLRHTLT